MKFDVNMIKDKNYFKYGIITFTSGKNINQSMEIKQSFDNSIILNTKLNYPIIVGYTGIYELNLDRIAEINSLSFDATSIQTINNIEDAYLIIDMVCERA